MYSSIKIPERMLALENLSSGGESYIIFRTKYYSSVDIEINKELYRDGLLPLGFSVIIKDKEKKLELEQWTFGRSEQPLPFQFPRSMVVYKDEFNRYSIEAYCEEFMLFYDPKEIVLYYGGRFTLKYLNITPEMGIFINEMPNEKPDVTVDLFDVLHSFYVNINRLADFDKLYGNVYKYERNSYVWHHIERIKKKEEPIGQTKKTPDKVTKEKEWKLVDEKSTVVDSDGLVLVTVYDPLVEYEKSPDDGRYPHFGLYLERSPDTEENIPIVIVRLIRRRLVHTIQHEFVEYVENKKFLIHFSGSNPLETPGTLTRSFPMRSLVLSDQDNTIFKEIPFENDYLSNDDKSWKYFSEIPTWELIRKRLRTFKDELLSMTPETIRLVKTDPFLDQRIRNKFEKDKDSSSQSFTTGLTQINKGWLSFVKRIQLCTHEFEALFLTWEFIVKSMGALWGELMCRYYFSFNESTNYDKSIKNSLVHSNGTYIMQTKKRMARHNIFSYCTLSSIQNDKGGTTEYNTPSQSKPHFDWDDPFSVLQKYNVMPLIQYPKDVHLQIFFGDRYTEETKEHEDIQLVRNYGHPRLKITSPQTIQIEKKHLLWEKSSSKPMDPFGVGAPPQGIQKMYFLSSRNTCVGDPIHDVTSIEVRGRWDGKYKCALYINKNLTKTSDIPDGVTQLLLVHEIPTSLFLSKEDGTILLEDTAYRHVTSDVLVTLPAVQPLDIVISSKDLALTKGTDILEVIRSKMVSALGLTTTTTIDIQLPFTRDMFEKFWFFPWSTEIISFKIHDGTEIRCRILRNDWYDLDTNQVYHNMIPNTYSLDQPENFTIVSTGTFIQRPRVWSGMMFPYIEMIQWRMYRQPLMCQWEFVLSHGFELSRFGWLPLQDDDKTFGKKRKDIFECFANILHEYRNCKTGGGHSKWKTYTEWEQQLTNLFRLEWEWNDSLRQRFDIKETLNPLARRIPPTLIPVAKK